VEAPDGSRTVLRPPEHVVQGQVVADRVLPAVRVVPVESEGGGEPAVDLVEIHLLVWSLRQSQFYQGSVGERRPDLVISVYFSVFRKLKADVCTPHLLLATPGVDF